MSLAPMNFLDGSSYADSDHQVGIVYVAYFGRASDPAGQAWWDSNLVNGQTIGQVAMNFAASAEAQNKYPFLAFPSIVNDSFRTTFITEVYNNLFNRNPDPASLTYFVLGAQNNASGQDITTEKSKTSVGLFFTQALARITATVFNTEARNEATSIVTNTTATNVASQETAITAFMTANAATLTNPND